MKTAQADLWTTPCDARCITTNGTVKANGRAVMGRGTAKQATQRYGGMALALGRLIEARGLHVEVVLDQRGAADGVPLVVFPVKYSWDEPASLTLIERSARELVTRAGIEGWQTVLLPRPGCGNGQRTWEEVAPILAPILDDRFVVVSL